METPASTFQQGSLLLGGPEAPPVNLFPGVCGDLGEDFSLCSDWLQVCGLFKGINKSPPPLSTNTNEEEQINARVRLKGLRV